MRRTSRDNAVCLKSLEKALAESPKTYRHIDLIAFGFPCQDISNANPKGKGLKGKRSSIFFECMRTVNILNPAWLLIENVPRLLSINEGRDFAVVLQTLSESGYGYSWRVLDSQYFGVAQRRKRVFIVGCFGGFCPPEILFEQKSSSRNDKKVKKMGQRGLCISTREGERQDPTVETLIASGIRGQDCPQVGNKGKIKHNFVASTIGQSQNPDPNYGTHFVAEKIPQRIKKGVHSTVRAGSEPGNRIQGYVAQTIGAGKRGVAGRIWEDTHIAEVNPKRKGKVARVDNYQEKCYNKVCTKKNLKDFMTNAVAEKKNQKPLHVVGNADRKKLLEFPSIALSVTNNSHQENQKISKLVPPDVLINCGENTVEIHSQGKFCGFVNSATNESSFPLPVPPENFVLVNVLLSLIAEEIIILGKVGLQAKEQLLIVQKNGKLLLRLSGKEIMLSAENVKSDLLTIKNLTKFITSYHSNTKDIEQKLLILFSCVINAIIGFIPKEIKNKNILSIQIQSNFGWTHGISDSRRGILIGNAVTVQVAEWIARRIYNYETKDLTKKAVYRRE